MSKTDHHRDENWHATECLAGHRQEAQEYADYLRDERDFLYGGDHSDSDSDSGYDW